MLRLADRRGLQRRAQALGGRLHERGVEGAGDVQAPGAGAGLVARDVLGLDERVDGPAEHELAGRVVVGDHEAQARGQRAHALRVAAEHRDHAARVAARRRRPSRRRARRRGGRRRRTAARRRRPAPRTRRASARRRRCASSSSSASSRHCVPGGDRAQEERGLLVARALGQALEGVVAEQLEAALEQRVAAVGLVHPLRVAPLSGEEQCAGWHRAISPQGAHAVATVRHTAVMCQMANSGNYGVLRLDVDADGPECRPPVQLPAIARWCRRIGRVSAR